MIVLGIESSARWAGAALADEDGLIGHFQAQHGGRTEHLHSILVHLFEETDLVQSTIGGVAVSTGPGSFTGLRIGLGAAKGISLATGCPIVGVPSLPLLFSRADLWTGGVAAWIDAGRGEVYGSYRAEGENALEPRTLPVRDHLEIIGGGETLFLGSGALRFRDEISSALREKGVFLPDERNNPSAAEVALYGYNTLHRGEGDPLDDLEPIYLREADARLPGGSGG